MQGSCQTRPQSGTLRRQAKISRSASAPLVRSRLVRKISARSARTRRSIRSSRGRLTERAVGGLCFYCGLVRNGNERVGCRDDSVKHTTSPPHRENMRRVIRSKVFQSQSAAAEQKHAWPLRRRYLSLSSSTRPRATRSRSLQLSSVSAFPLSEAHQAQRQEIQTQNIRPHIAMGYQLSFAWKASLTRTPPPICTSALGSQTALVRRAMGVANE